MKDQKKQKKIMLAWTLAWLVSLGALSGAENSLWDNKIYTIIGLIINFGKKKKNVKSAPHSRDRAVGSSSGA